MLDVLRENLDVEAQSGSGDLAIGPVDPMCEAKLAVQVEGGHAVSLVGHGKVEGLQEGIDQILLAFVARAGKQFGGHEQVGAGAARNGPAGKKCDRISATAETIDQD
ncbi:MAG: hypothetical protein ABSH22_18695 [Tepidisphaeraceae bacterium]